MQWSPRGRETTALGVVAVGLALAVLLLDAPGRVLVGTAALVLLAVVAHDLRVRPRLAPAPPGWRSAPGLGPDTSRGPCSAFAYG